MEERIEGIRKGGSVGSVVRVAARGESEDGYEGTVRMAVRGGDGGFEVVR